MNKEISELQNCLENCVLALDPFTNEYLGINKPSLLELFELKNICEKEIIKRMIG